MKLRMLRTVGTAVIVLMASTGLAFADQARPRNPGAAGGGGGGGHSGGDSGGGDTGRVATPRGGGSSPWDGGAVSARPTTPRTTGSSTRARRGGDGDGGGVVTTVPGYSRPRDGASPTGRAMARSSVGTLPPIISGPIYWGPGGDSWYFYPWGYGGLGLGYLWDPLFWGGYGNYWGGSPYGYGGYGYGGYGYGNYGGYGGYGSGMGSGYGGGGGYSSSSRVQAPDAEGGLRLRVKPREAGVEVDGYFAGTVDDFDGAFQKLTLPAGPHRVEVKAPGYESLAFDVLVIEDETTTYKGELTRVP